MDKPVPEKAAAPADWKGVHVLVYTKNGKGYVHDNIAAASACIRQLGKQNGFSVDTSSNPADFTEANLKKYNVLFFNNTNNDVFDTDAQKVAFMRFVQAGGGFVGLHSASGTERNWPWFKRLLGATFLRHAKHQKFKEIIIDAQHPSTTGLPPVWERDDECYYVKEMNPDLHVLLVHDLSSVDDKDKPEFFGATFPSVWCHEFDGGRQWYTSLGHDSATYREPVFQKHLLGGLQWVVGKATTLNYKKARAVSPSDALPY
ncbi:MAG: ThuA domain-containing protein [Williamsia sp.]|nr:ThuA domain-containing protein [Williamsia sp.]